ncbi:metallophosphoesterase family protein [Allofustis seminis]|uniref:metallophosphoesterase family protein n=1 Tax=Allofustis seminis TaxID=166939 RepID=UPI000364F921|nr:YfcE family phosphodiesterase [Allofustis seminis]
MRALITSDTHTRDAGLYELAEKYRETIDLWIHCGDSELEPTDPALKNFHVVSGNTDCPGNFQLIEDITWHQLNIMVTHGDRFNVRFGIEELYKEALKRKANIVFYGHTHIAKVDKKDSIYFINPGSLHFPRGTFSQGTYAILEEMDGKYFITFYTQDHQLIKEWRQELIFD